MDTLPPVRPIFEDYVAGFGLADRLQFRDAGFRETYVEHRVGPDSMVVGVK